MKIQHNHIEFLILNLSKIAKAFIFLLLIFQIGCSKAIDIDAPVTNVNQKNVYDNDASAISVLTGIYSTMGNNGVYCGPGGLSVLLGLSADELTLYSGVTSSAHIAHYKNALVSNASQSIGVERWNQFYKHVFVCNSAIDGLSSSSGLSPSVKQQLLGEAKFIRGLLLFYLQNLYGDIPMPLTTDPNINATLSRSSKADVFQQIINDLTDAKALLSDQYLDGSLHQYTERLRPTKWAAIAMLSRVYLYLGRWGEAEAQSTEIINNAGLYGLVSLSSCFLKNNKEAIWQLQPVIQGHNTEDGWVFILPGSGPSDITVSGGYPVYISPQLLNSFDSSDNRKTLWLKKILVNGTTFYCPFKYESASLGAPVTEYETVLRLGEQYLIRAEARVQQNDISGAKSDLDSIRLRAGLPASTLNDKSGLLSLILHERQVELFTEWGHRWLDLKRTSIIDNVMTTVTPQKSGGSPWQPYQQWYPIPFYDLQRDQNLIQNNGY